MRPYLDFLSALSENNHKDWMDANKKWYLDTKATLVADTEVLLKTMVELESSMASFKAKDCLFRQNRDVRFSANKNPFPRSGVLPSNSTWKFISGRRNLDA